MNNIDEYYNNVFIPVMAKFMERLKEIADEVEEKIGEKNE